MTYPFVGPVEVPTATADTHPVRKEQLDDGLATKSDTDHVHGDDYAAAIHTHAGADIDSGTVAVGRLPTGTSGSTVALGDHTHSGFAATTHVHAGADITSGTVPIAAIPTGTTGSTVPFGNDARFTDARTPTSHVHSGADITSGTVPIAQIPTGTSGTTVSLGNHNHDAAYSALGHAHAGADITSGTVAIARIPTGTSGTTVALGNHDHASVYAALSHAHAGADITSGTVDIARLPTGTSGSTVAIGNHVHAAADVTSGTFAIGRIPTGTSSSTVAIGNDTRLSVKPYAPVTLTDQANVATDASLGNHFRLTGTTTRVFSAPTNPTDGQVIVYEIKATSGTPNHTWNSVFGFGSDVTGTTALAAGKTDFVQFCYNASATKWNCIGYIKGLTT